ncbi:hypothetical protein PRIPAC_78603, partial [Pristionchus pacificus]|uniref:G protein-coupled receptor n=1 Tax=Pristionchus pacificus TaxID=54126 RepID=A0A2A6CN73_PRIPA
PAKLIRFTNPAFIGLLAMYPLGQAIGWSWLAFQNATDASYYVQDFYFSHYNETITGWRENDEFNARAFLIIFAAVLVMAVNFSIATFLASQTIVHLRQANAFTSNNKAKQMAILQALFAQASVPVLFVYIPFGCAIISPFLGLDFVYPIANATMTMTSFFPVMWC